MNWLRKFFRLPSADRRLLIGTAILLGVVRLGLWLLPFPTLRRLLAGLAQPRTGGRQAEPPSSDRVLWAVAAASRYVPGARSCLAQALVTQVLLARRGVRACLRLGVSGREGRFQAHAWLESQGKVILGGRDLARFVPLPALDGERR